MAREGELNQLVAVCMARREPAARKHRLLLRASGEVPHVHDGTVDAADGQASMPLKILRTVWYPVSDPVWSKYSVEVK